MGETSGRAVAPDPKTIVARGYDAIALRYAEWAAQVDSPDIEWVRELARRLPERSDVLELGCGRGVPVARELARRHRVTGVDISSVQIELARHHVPEASFVQADATELEVAALSQDAVVALFVFGHIPADEQRELIPAVGRWLREGGLLLANFPTGDAGEGVAADWLGTEMFFASLDGEEYLPLVREAGLEPVRHEVVGQHEPGHGDVFFRWVLAQAGTAA